MMPPPYHLTVLRTFVRSEEEIDVNSLNHLIKLKGLNIECKVYGLKNLLLNRLCILLAWISFDVFNLEIILF